MLLPSIHTVYESHSSMISSSLDESSFLIKRLVGNCIRLKSIVRAVQILRSVSEILPLRSSTRIVQRMMFVVLKSVALWP